MAETAAFCREEGDIGPRVAWWLKGAYPDCIAKRAARDFGVSERQAQRWANGERPTVDHLTAMTQKWGWRFVHFVFEGVLPPPEAQLHDRMDRLVEDIAAIRKQLWGEP